MRRPKPPRTVSQELEMGIREKVNENPAITISITAGALVLLTVIILLSSRSDSQSYRGTGAKAFFSVDGGTSYFLDDVDKIPPFKTVEGKTAYRARVVKCGNDEPYVAYLEKYSEEDKRRLEDAMKQSGVHRPVAMQVSLNTSAMVKLPGTGDGAWVEMSPKTSSQYMSIIRPKCADGSDAVRVNPE
jgi:hypothetical protein